jgi:hypothetical protein
MAFTGTLKDWFYEILPDEMAPGTGWSSLQHGIDKVRIQLIPYSVSTAIWQNGLSG